MTDSDMKEIGGSSLVVYFEFLRLLIYFNVAGLFLSLFLVVLPNEVSSNPQIVHFVFFGITLISPFVLGLVQFKKSQEPFDTPSPNSRSATVFDFSLAPDHDDITNSNPSYAALLLRKWHLMYQALFSIQTIKRNQRMGDSSSNHHGYYRFLSFILYICVLSSYVFIQWLIQRAFYNKNVATFWVSALLSIAHVIFKQSWRFFCFLLTLLEKHEFAAEYRRWYFIKLYSFDLITYMAYYATRAAILKSRYTSLSQCYLDLVKEQHLSLLFTYLFFNNFIEIAHAKIYNWILGQFAHHGPYQDEYYKIAFELPEEYAESMFRQFIIFLSQLMWPTLAPVIGVVSSIVEYWVDRYKVLRLCRIRTPFESDFRNLILFSQIVSSCLLVITYPAGFLWINLNFFPYCN